MAVVIANSVTGTDGATEGTGGFNIDSLTDISVSPDAIQVVAATSNFVRLSTEPADNGTDTGGTDTGGTDTGGTDTGGTDTGGTDTGGTDTGAAGTGGTAAAGADGADAAGTSDTPGDGTDTGASGSGGYDVLLTGQFTYNDGSGTDGTGDGSTGDSGTGDGTGDGGSSGDNTVSDITSVDQISGDSQINSIQVSQDGHDLVTVAGLTLTASDFQSLLGNTTGDGNTGDGSGGGDGASGGDGTGDGTDAGVATALAQAPDGGTGDGDGGQSATDTLLSQAFSGQDLMIGSDQGDLLRGFDGDDVIQGGLGNDSLDGGQGFDTLNLTGNRADWTFTQQTPTDGGTGDGGTGGATPETGGTGPGDALGPDGTGDTTPLAQADNGGTDTGDGSFTGSEGHDLWLATNATTGEVDTITDFDLVSFDDGAVLIEDLVGGGTQATSGIDATGIAGAGPEAGASASSDIWLA